MYSTHGISAIHDKVIVSAPFLGLNGPEIVSLSLLFHKMLDIISFTTEKKKRHGQTRKHYVIKNMKDTLFSLFEKNIFYF